MNLDHKDIFEWTALHYACQRGNLSCVKLLIEKGKLGINNITSSNNSALHIAAKNGHLLVCKYLVEDALPFKADVLIKGLDNDTAKDASADMGKEEVARYLDYHQNKMQHWKNRGALIKIYQNKKYTKPFKNFSEGIFKEIMKFA